MELQPYLKSTYEDEILECTTCFEIVTKVGGLTVPEHLASLYLPSS